MPKKRNKKGRAIGDMLLGVREEFQRRLGGKSEVDNILTRIMKLGKEKWKIVGLYINRDIEIKLEKMRVDGRRGRKSKNNHRR